MVVEQFEYRELLVQMTLRDLLLRYKQSVMGFGWAVLMPIVNTVIFTVIFARVAKLETPVAYPVFAFCGFWVWNAFAAALAFGSTALVSNSTLVTKVYFPREIFPFSAVFVCTVDFFVGILPLAVLMIWYQIPVGIHLLWLPLVFLVHTLFTVAMALLLSMANLFFRDVKYLVNIGLQVWMFATPVVYDIDTVTGKLGTVLRLNPMTPIVEGYRHVLLYNQAPPATLVTAGLVSLVAFFGGWLWFHRSEFKFAESV